MLYMFISIPPPTGHAHYSTTSLMAIWTFFFSFHLSSLACRWLSAHPYLHRNYVRTIYIYISLDPDYNSSILPNCSIYVYSNRLSASWPAHWLFTPGFPNMMGRV
ncbi:hypothetical protein F4809DRAFT_629614 [Biscogniauxia mediterranea]|nr:hypothetical protein F4809DRAFT_629614 [Biscogniauxia mediterranea]